MISEVRKGDECYSDAQLEITTCEQDWDHESLQELKDDHHIIFMSKSDAVFPVQIIMSLDNKPKYFRIGVEDDGTLFFGNTVNIYGSTKWIDSLIEDLQATKEFINTLNN